MHRIQRPLPLLVVKQLVEPGHAAFSTILGANPKRVDRLPHGLDLVSLLCAVARASIPFEMLCASIGSILLEHKLFRQLARA